MKQQIIVSGIGGQGVLFLTRVIAEAASEMGLDVLTSETHGMAMRGGTVVSHVKTGHFKSPLIRRGQADVGFFLYHGNTEVHGGFLKQENSVFINTPVPVTSNGIDATAIAKEGGSIVIANLVLLGYALRQGGLFCDAKIVEAAIRRISRPKELETNLKGLKLGLEIN